MFKRHALAVFKGIDNIVQSADNLVEAEDKLKALGKLHQKRPVGPLEFEVRRTFVILLRGRLAFYVLTDQIDD